MLYFAKWKIGLILVVCALGLAYAAPNLFSRATTEDLPDWLPNQQINLGLDLQGGSHLLMEVDVAAVVEEWLSSLVDEVRIELRKARIGYKNLGVEGDAVTFTLTDPARMDEAVDLIEDIQDGLVVETAGGDTVKLRLSEQQMDTRHQAVVEQSIEIVRRRIDETGTREPTIQRQGEDRILVQLPGVKNPERIKSLIGQTAKLTLHLVDPNASVRAALDGKVPAGAELLPAAPSNTSGQSHYVVRKRVVVSGERLVDAQPTLEQGRPVVSFRFDSIGGKKFGDATQENVGKQLAIVLDGEVISAPVIREAILGGSGVISGDFSLKEVQDLALLLRAGALPAPLTILEERTVGPSLGADSVRAGKIASVLALAMVVVFMVVAYGFFGLLADVALILNLILITALLSALQATLTLPGIAGIVLTIGMAVDANVLIFERIREEVRGGRTPLSAVDAGYQRALTTIVDANITTLIAAVLLYAFGSGPVRGFAVTLSFGLVTSMFTAIMVTRLMVVMWLRRKRPQMLPI